MISVRNSTARVVGLLCVAALAAVVTAEPAFAQSAAFQPINNAFNQILQLLSGPFATTAATIAVAAAGYMALTSRIPWSWCFSIVVGCAFIFGGAQIVSSLSSGLGN